MRQRFNIYGIRLGYDWEEEEVQIFQSVSDVLLSWNHLDESGYLFIHIGSVRPTLPDEFPDVPLERGRIIVSEAARWHLPAIIGVGGPSLFTVDAGFDTSPVPVRQVTSGCGYHDEAEEVKEVPDSSSEKSYTELLEEINAGSQILFDELLARSPNWFLGVELSSIDFTVRVTNVLKRQALKRVGDLHGLGIEELLSWPNIGRRSILDLTKGLISALQAPRNDWYQLEYRLPVVNQDDKSRQARTNVEATSQSELNAEEMYDSGMILESLHSSLDRWLRTRANQRNAELFRLRHAIGVAPKPLQSIGETYNLTRERVRQIVERISSLYYKTESYKTTASKLRELILYSDTPIYLDHLQYRDQWFDVSLREVADGKVFFRLWRDVVTVIDFKGRPVLVGRTDFKSYDAILKDYKARIIDDVSTKRDLIDQVTSLARADGFISVAGDLIQDIEDSSLTRSLQDGTVLFDSDKLTAESVVASILDNAAMPMTVDAILEEAESILSKRISKEGVRRFAREAGYVFGRSTYGLPRHLRQTTDKQEIIASLVEGVVSETSVNRQWHCDEFLKMLQEEYPGWRHYPNKYEINVIVAERTTLKSLGRLVWTTEDGADERLNIMEVAFEVLKDRGEPISEKHLASEIAKIRGMSEYIALTPTDQVTRLTTSLWGLVYRDFGLTHAEIGSLLLEVEKEVEKRGDGSIDLTLLWIKVGKTPPSREYGSLAIYGQDLLKGLLQSDSRFSIDTEGRVRVSDI